MKIFFPISVVVLAGILITSPAFAQIQLDQVIQNYEKAIKKADPTEVSRAWSHLSRESSAVNYIQVNRPQLYHSFSQGPKYIPSLQNKRKSNSSSIDEQSTNFPNQDLLDHARTVEFESNQDHRSNRRVALDFPNKDAVDNKERIRQIQAQERIQPEFIDLDPDAVVLTVSGLALGKGEDVAEMLGEQFGQIDQILHQGYDRGVWYAVLKLRAGNIEDLSQRIDSHVFPSFSLERVSLSSYQANFIYKPL